MFGRTTRILLSSGVEVKRLSSKAVVGRVHRTSRHGQALQECTSAGISPEASSGPAEVDTSLCSTTLLLELYLAWIPTIDTDGTGVAMISTSTHAVSFRPLEKRTTEILSKPGPELRN
jgi:hypothetical protein